MTRDVDYREKVRHISLDTYFKKWVCLDVCCSKLNSHLRFIWSWIIQNTTESFYLGVKSSCWYNDESEEDMCITI